MKRWQRIKAELAERFRRKRARKQRIWARRMLDTPRHLWPAGVSAYRVLMEAPLTPREVRILRWETRDCISDERVQHITVPSIQRIVTEMGRLLPQSGYALSHLAEAAGLRNEVIGDAITAEHIRAMQERLNPMIADYQAAYARALATLRLFLTDAEQAQLDEHGYFELPSRLTPNRVYRVPLHDGVVSVYDDGEKTMTICCRPEDDSVPWPDVMLAYKLGLQADEARWLETANKWATATTNTVDIWNEEALATCSGFYLTPTRAAVETFLPRRVAEEVLRREASDADGLAEVREVQANSRL